MPIQQTRREEPAFSQQAPLSDTLKEPAQILELSAEQLARVRREVQKTPALDSDGNARPMEARLAEVITTARERPLTPPKKKAPAQGTDALDAVAERVLGKRKDGPMRVDIHYEHGKVDPKASPEEQMKQRLSGPWTDVTVWAPRENSLGQKYGLNAPVVAPSKQIHPKDAKKQAKVESASLSLLFVQAGLQLGYLKPDDRISFVVTRQEDRPQSPPHVNVLVERGDTATLYEFCEGSRPDFTWKKTARAGERPREPEVREQISAILGRKAEDPLAIEIKNVRAQAFLAEQTR